ncbi:MAG: metal ABC transporter permease [Gemmataceae bacterium]|nr:metal ABC transporter permease [Gemmataceae bacterium]
MLAPWLKDAIDSLAATFHESAPGSFLSFTFNIKALIAVVLVSIICGAVGALIVGNRMAFFSDAMAHCAFAGVAIGLLAAIALQAQREGPFFKFGVPLIMINFGGLVGLAIGYVREKTSLSADTVIGVFFAGAMGFGAMLFKVLGDRSNFNPDAFLFGDLVSIGPDDLIVLFVLTVVTVVLMAAMYNPLVFSSFNPSLARSRRVPQRLCNYAFIVLLALIVNLCLTIVGALLINALLVVPAATAAILCRNMRQMFWMTIGLTLFAGVAGVLLTWQSHVLDFPLGTGGLIVVLSVLLFFLAMIASPLLRRRVA